MEYSEKRHSLFINNVTLCELVGVLKKGYSYTKDHILETLQRLVSIEKFCFQDVKTITKAITLYEKGKADFPDYLSFAINEKAGCLKAYSFDHQSVQKDIFEDVLEMLYFSSGLT